MKVELFSLEISIYLIGPLFPPLHYIYIYYISTRLIFSTPRRKLMELRAAEDRVPGDG